MSLLAQAGDLSGAESPPQGSLLDGCGGSWSRGSGSFGGGGGTAGATGAMGQLPPAMMPPLSVPPPPPLLAAHQISVDDEENLDRDRDADASSSDSDADDSGATSASSVFTLCNSAIGAGVLSLPFAFRRAGLGGGLLLCCAVGSIEAFTLCVFFFLSLVFSLALFLSFSFSGPFANSLD